MFTSPTIRLFVSSTFSDLKAERDALQREVFPRLKQLCLSKGLRFQAIDLRWGISEEAGRDNRTMRICLRELRRCQQDRPKPNFLILLGDRYGWRPLPFEIVPDEFEALRDHLTADERRLIEWSETKSDNCAAWREGNTQPRVGWYRLDRNAVPSDEQPPGVYVLQPRKLDVPAGATDKQKEKLAKHESADWTRIESEIHAAFARAIQRLGWAEDDLRRIKYEASATHQEILHGALNLKVDDARWHVHAFTRTIRLPAGQSAHKDFVDRLPDGSEDYAARVQHGQLRDKLLSHLTKDNLHEYTVDWREEGKFTADDLKEFCEQAWKQLSAVVERQIAALAKVPPDEQEEQAHQDFGKERCRRFVGRAEPLERIAAYLRQETGKLLAVVGPSGSGKSAVMAKAVEKVTSDEWRVASAKTEIICRFIGATPASSDLIQLLRNLVGEIRKRYTAPVRSSGFSRSGSEPGANAESGPPEGGTPNEKTDSEIPFEYNPLVNAFHEALKRPTADRPLFVFLDALDQLTASHNAHSLAWLPGSLNPHVRLIVSAALPTEPGNAFTPSLSHRMGEGGRRPGEGDSPPATRHSSLSPDPRATIMSALTSRLDLEQRITLAPLTVADGEQMLTNWLVDAHRTLQLTHRQAILETFQVEGSPLWLRTAAEEAARLASWQPAPTFAPTAPGLLGQVLERLSREEEHGDKLVSRTLSYLACARHGLAEDEILDILSADKEVMDDFRRRSPNSPKVDSLPVAVWVRLHGDLAFYLAEHQAQGASLLDFYHRSFLEAVTAHCFASRETRKTRHQHMSVYFLDSAKGRDPAKEWETDAVRGFAECVFHLVKAGQHERAAALVSNFPFLLHKLRMGQLQGVFEDYEMLRSETPAEVAKKLEIWAAFFREKAHILRRGNDEWLAHKILLQLAVEHADDSPLTKGAERWLDDDRCGWLWLRRVPRLPHAQKNPCLAVLEGHTSEIWGALALTDGRLVSWAQVPDYALRLWDSNGICTEALEGHTDDVKGVLVLTDGRLLSWSNDGTLRLWDSRSGTCLTTLEGHTGAVRGGLALRDGRLLSWSEDGTLRLWDSRSGSCLTTFGKHTNGVRGALVLVDGRIVSWSHWRSTLWLWNSQTGACIGTIEGHTGDIEGALELRDGRLLSWSRDYTLRLWDSQTGACLSTLEGHRDTVYGALELANGPLLSWSSDRTLRLWDCQSGNCETVLKGHTEQIYDVRVLPSGQLLSWSRDKTVRLWDSRGGTCLATLRGHTVGVNGALALGDGRILSWSDWPDCALRLWDSHSGVCLTTLEGHTSGVLGALILADGRVLSWSRDKTLRFWDCEGNGSPVALEGHKGRVGGVLASTNGRLLTWSGRWSDWQEDSLRLWNSQTGGCLSTLEGHTDSVHGALELANGRLLSWSSDRTLRLWDGQSGQCLAVLEGHSGNVLGALALSDGQLLSWSSDGTLRLWDSQTGACRAILEGHTGHIYGVLVLADGRLLSWSGDATLRLWHSQTGALLETLWGHRNAVVDALVLADGRLLSWSSQRSWSKGEREFSLRLWNVGKSVAPRKRSWWHLLQEVLRLFGVRICAWSTTLQGHTSDVNGVLELADGRLLSWGDKLRLWDSQSGACLATLGGDIGASGALALDDERILSWSRWPDLTFRLWDSQCGDCLEVVDARDLARLHSDWALAHTRATNTAGVVGWFYLCTSSSIRTGELHHGASPFAVARWEAEVTSTANCLLPDGCAVLTLDSGQVCILQLHHGNRRVSLDEAEAILAGERKNSE